MVEATLTAGAGLHTDRAVAHRGDCLEAYPSPTQWPVDTQWISSEHRKARGKKGQSSLF